jgi:HD-like signal output (HDOD) protein
MPHTQREHQVRALPDLIKNYLEDRIRTNSFELPMLPKVAGEVMEMCNADDTDAAKLSQTIHRDQSLAGHVLRVANSPAIRPQTPIVSLQQAISRLGMQQIVEIALAISVKGKVFSSSKHMDLVHDLWGQSVASGCFAKEVARQRRRNVETTFLCGLLHNVGKPVVLDAVTTLEEDVGRSFPREDVLRALDAYHAEVGGQLALHWQLPPPVVEAIRHHEDYNEASAFAEVAMTVNLAMYLARLAIEPDEAARAANLLDIQQMQVLEDLNLYPDDREKLVGHVDRIRETAEATI